MRLEMSGLLSPLTGKRRWMVRAAAMAAMAMLACFPAAPRAQAQTTTITVTSLAGDGSSGTLGAAIVQSASTPSGQSTVINFQSGLTGTILLQNTLYVCNGQTLTIQGPGAAQILVSGQGTVQDFYICGGTNVTISGVTIENGNADDSPVQGEGGGLINFGTLAVITSTFSGNSAGGVGGGIENVGTLTVSSSTFSGNSAGYDGGGVDNGGTATVTNSTFSGNSTTGEGGGIANTQTLSLTNDTISGNSATNGGGGILDVGSAVLTVKSNILANNTGGNCSSGGSASQGYNLSDDASCNFGNTGDKNDTPAGLDPKGLQNNGGPTQTIALLSTSPAVDAIPVGSCTDTSGNRVTTDQRGVSRPQGPACDIGAYELVESVPFASFKAELAIFTQKPYGYAVDAVLTPGSGSSGITPASEAVTLQIASYTVTIPAGSFHKVGGGANAPYAYEGTINGVRTGAVIAPLSGNRYDFAAAGSPVNLTGAANPVTVKLTIGTNSGTATVRAIRLR